MELNEQQQKALESKLPKDRISTRKGPKGQSLDYVEAWSVIARANEVFGFNGWTYEIIEVVLVSERTVEKSSDSGKYIQCVVTVRSRVRVVALGVSREDVGLCTGTASEANGADAHDMAWKGAVSDGLKRALRTFGHSFGLALYDKDREFVGPSEDSQSLIDAAAALPDDVDATKAWWKANEAGVTKLAAADQETIVAAINAKNAAAAERTFERRINDATDLASVAKLAEAVVARNLSARATDRLTELCKARKAALSRKAA